MPWYWMFWKGQLKRSFRRQRPIALSVLQLEDRITPATIESETIRNFWAFDPRFSGGVQLAEEDKTAATRADNCARAKAYARTLDEGMRLSRTNAKGEREIIDDGNRAEEVKRAKSVIASDCK